MSLTDRLLKSVAGRQRVNGLLGLFARMVLVFGALYALLLVASRLLSLAPVPLEPLAALAVPCLAALGAIAFHRGGGREAAARFVDARLDTKDLFLTHTRLDTAPGEYAPLVSRAAEDRAGRIEPGSVAPVVWRRPATLALSTVLPLLALTWALPQLDPFGIHAEKEAVAQRKKDLGDQKKLADERIAALKSQALSDELSDKVEQSLEELRAAFDEMRPQEMQANLDRLNLHQRGIGEQWRRLNEQNLHKLEASDSQRFGQVNPQAHEWKKQLERGDASGLRKEMEGARQLAQRLAQSTDPKEQRELREQIERKLRAMNEFAQNQAKTPELEAALRKAMEQLQAAHTQGLNSEGMEALDSSLELAGLELDALAQSMRDMKALEDALKLIAMGKIANAGGRLDGDLSRQLAALEGYVELYEKICKECGEGECKPCNGAGRIEGKVGVCPFCKGTGGAGLGMGGPGRGRGNVAPEDDSLVSGFKTEKSKTAIQAGKMLLQWKENELPEAGASGVDYATNIALVKQGVSEAILAEQVPPGYHEGIKKYFDSIDADEQR